MSTGTGTQPPQRAARGRTSETQDGPSGAGRMTKCSTHTKNRAPIIGPRSNQSNNRSAVQCTRHLKGSCRNVGDTRFELVTPSVSGKCATSAPTARLTHHWRHPAMKRHLQGSACASGQRDSDPRSRPWQGRALPTKLCPQCRELRNQRSSGRCRNRTYDPFGVNEVR